MPVHLSGFSGAVNGSAAYVALPAMTDSFYAISGDNQTPPRDVKGLAAAAGGSGLTRARREHFWTNRCPS